MGNYGVLKCFNSEKLDEHGSYTVIHRHNYVVMVLKYLVVGVTSIAVRVLLGLP